jgi:hypothetical protein
MNIGGKLFKSLTKQAGVASVLQRQKSDRNASPENSSSIANRFPERLQMTKRKI